MKDMHECNICKKNFTVPARLIRHYRTHTGEKPFNCEYCNKSFSVKENLSVHRRIHTKERPYKCNICTSAFEHSGKLHRHMRIHTGERPHKCSICNKTFIQSGQLVIHMRTHTGEKPYLCKNCGKGFTCSKQLKVHNRTHTGEKPYECEICGKCFGYNHVLKLHQVAHYGEKFYRCTLCEQIFNSKKFMELHILSHSDSLRNDVCVEPSNIKSSYTHTNKTPKDKRSIDNEDIFVDNPKNCLLISHSLTNKQPYQDSKVKDAPKVTNSFLNDDALENAILKNNNKCLIENTNIFNDSSKAYIVVSKYNNIALNESKYINNSDTNQMSALLPLSEKNKLNLLKNHFDNFHVIENDTKLKFTSLDLFVQNKRRNINNIQNHIRVILESADNGNVNVAVNRNTSVIQFAKSKEII